MAPACVSVYCLSYNHEAYIREALEGFVRQRTGFPFEVIVHDDASTDGTAAVIRAYEKRYPDLIRPVLQTKNQWSRGVSIVEEFILPRAQGRYIAVCEGDDYWTDPLKLQKQYDYMEAHPQCPLCFTNAVILDDRSGRRRTFIPYSRADKRRFDPEREDYDLGSFHCLSFIPTCSFFFRKSCYEALMRAPVRHCPADDLRLRLFMASLGPVHFFNEKMCVYRKNHSGSMMESWRRQGREEAARCGERNYGMLSDLDRYTGHRYHRELAALMGNCASGMLEGASLAELFKDPAKREVFRAVRLRWKLSALIRAAARSGRRLILT